MGKIQLFRETRPPPVDEGSSTPKVSSRRKNPLKIEKHKLFIRTFIVATLAIFLVETGVMYLLEGLLDIAEPLVWYIDGVVLIFILFPLNYFFIIVPMMKQAETRYQARKELNETSEILEGIFTISDMMIGFLDQDFNFIRVNKAYADYNQQSVEYFTGKNHFELFPDDENHRIFTNVKNTGKAFHVQDRPFSNAAHPEFGITYWDWSLIPILNSENITYGLILALIDTTERKNDQLSLKESENRFRGVFNQTLAHLVLLNTDGQVILVNQIALDYLNSSASEIIGKYFWEIPWWDIESDLEESIKSKFQFALKGEVVFWEQRVFSPTHNDAVLDVTLKPLVDELGKTNLLIYEGHDITERIAAESKLQESLKAIDILYKSEANARQEAELLRNAVLSMGSALSKDTVLEALLDQLQQNTRYTSAHIFLVEDKDHLRTSLVRGDENWPEDKRLKGKKIDDTAQPLIHKLLEGSAYFYLPDTTGYEGTSYFPGKEFIGSWVSLPLLAGNQLIGLVILEHYEPNFFTPKMLDLATTLTYEASFAIHNAWLFEQVEYAREQLRALSRELVRVQEAERLHIARELHDEAGQLIASLKYGLALLEKNNSNPSDVAARSFELRNVADEVLDSLHRLSADLRPPSLDHLGMVPAIRSLADSVGKLNNLVVNFVTEGYLTRFSEDSETAIYRIVQEALTNVVNHAHATKVNINLENHEDRLMIVIEDDGIGFDPNANHIDRLGLVGMSERAAMLGGSLKFEVPPNGGTRIVLEVPCQSAS